MITNPFPPGTPMWHTFEKLDKNDPNLQKPEGSGVLDTIGGAVGSVIGGATSIAGNLLGGGSKTSPTPVASQQSIAPTIQPMQGNLQVARVSNEPEQSFFERNKKPLLIGTVVLITIIVIMVVVAKQTKKTK